MTVRLEADPTDAVLLAARGQTSTIAVAEQESSAVHRAVRDLALDLERVCGAQIDVLDHARAGVRVVVGTLGTSPLVQTAVASGKLDVSSLHDSDGAPWWEGFLLRAVGDVLWIVGADHRGTIFGVYELCESIGVSPWHWFADVPVHQRDHVAVAADTAHAAHPSVRYRGIFLNDEEQLEAWAKRHTDDDTIGPQTYERVFELVLRLKGNYVWPAMHVNAFNHDPVNGHLAHEMGMVIGTSHCDMLLRSNQHEWEPWAAAQNEPVVYDYSFPGRNRDLVREYWRGSVEQNGDYDVTWNVGMRGIHDSGFHTAAIDADDTLSEEEKQQARVELLGQVIADQRALLSDVLGEERAQRAPQLFVPYKEVLPLYDAGLTIPDDVTIVWTDDSFGYVRRFPDEAERTRAGGHGLYYHSSYWSPPPRSYLFIGSAPLAHMKAELGRAWENGIQTLWVNNVGALKPLELETEFFLRYAWEVGQETTTSDITQFVARWVNQQVSGGHGERAARLYEDFAQITNVTKVEHMHARAFTQTGHGDEAGRRLLLLRELYVECNNLLDALPGDEREAFFQLLGLRVHASYLTNGQFYYADRSTLAYEQGKMPAADHYLAVSRAFDGHKRAMLQYYNQVLAGGKWDGILTPEAFPPPATALFPAARPALTIGPPALAVVVWGEDGPSSAPQLSFDPGGTATKWIEIANRGAGALEYTISADDWLHVAASSGKVEYEERVEVQVMDPRTVAGRTGTIIVHSPTDGSTVTVHVRVGRDDPYVHGVEGHLEGDGYLSLHAAHADERRGFGGLSWEELPAAGRGGGSLMRARPATTPESPLEQEDAVLLYQFVLTTPGAHLLELHRFPTLDATGQIRVAVSVDAHPPVVLASPTLDEHSGAWEDAVVQQVERLHLRLPWLDAGPHVLRVHAVDPWFAFSHLVIHTAARRSSTLAPPRSAHTRRGRQDEPELLPQMADLNTLDLVSRDLYRTRPTDVPPHPVVYVRRHYWDTETTFTRNEAVPQTQLGPSRYLPRADGTKDVLAALPDAPATEHEGHLALEVEAALAQNARSWLTPSIDEPVVGWSHTQAETDGGTGLALHVDVRGRQWHDPSTAPGIHQRVIVTSGGTYHVWLLVKFDSNDDDACVLALDGVPQPVTEQFSGGSLFSFGTAQLWHWTHLSDITISPGTHTLSLLARRSGLRVDRLYLTLGDELPPPDATWPRHDHRPAERKALVENLIP